MDVQFTAEQRALRDSCGKLAADLASRWHRGRGPTDVAPPTPDDDGWTRIVDAGWLAMGLREDNGGVGASTVDLGIVVEQLGAHAVAAPVLGTVIASAQLEAWGAPRGLLEDIASGGMRVAPALDPELRTFAHRDGLAWDAAGADVCLLPADARLHLLGAPVPFADLTRAVRPVGQACDDRIKLSPPEATASSRLHAFALSLLVVDLLGSMQAALNAAVEHARAREQFGAPVGSFQAVQQILADSHVLVEATRSASSSVSSAVDALPADESLRAARVAKSYAARSAIEVCENSVQVFGGIGMTWESPAHVWLRRAHADRLVFGNEHYHQDILMADLVSP